MIFFLDGYTASRPRFRLCDEAKTSTQYYVTIMLLWSIEPKIDWNSLLPAIKSMVETMIVSNSAPEAERSRLDLKAVSSVSAVELDDLRKAKKDTNSIGS